MNHLLRRVSLNVFVASVLMLFGGAMAGKVLEKDSKTSTVFVGLVLFAIGAYLQNWKPSQIGDFRTTGIRKQLAPQREILIQFLSVGSILPEEVTLTGDLQDDLQKLAEKKREHFLKHRDTPLANRPKHWAWEQTLRGIFHNLNTEAGEDSGPLRKVILIASPQSIVLVHQFYQDVLSRYAALIRKVAFQVYLKSENRLLTLSRTGPPQTASDGVDFESFDEVAIALEEVWKKLLAETPQENLEKKLQIDVTGGQKPNSMVAGAMTILSDITNQYVSTNPRSFDDEIWTYEVIGYDVFKRMR